MKRNRITAILAAAILTLQCMPINATGNTYAADPSALMSHGSDEGIIETASIPDNYNADYSGECGDHLTWTLDTTAGVLAISGTGNMWDYGSLSEIPWFSNRTYINEVTIGDGVTHIGNCAFFGCSSLTAINIPESVTSIGNSVFENCSSLTAIDIPDSVASIGYNAFCSCSSLRNIDIPNSVESINNSTFSGCISLPAVSIPDSVKVIDSYAFGGCSSLTTIDIPGSVASIGGSAFSYCSSLTTVNISNGVTSIGYGSFEKCTSLTNIYMPGSITSIGYYAFDGCSSLTTVDIPGSVTSIGKYAFENCSSLASINVDAANSYYSSDTYGVLFNKNKTTLIKYPIGNTRTSYEIPGSVTSIAERAFLGCTSLTNMNIPAGVTSIGKSAFDNCSGLTGINVDAANSYYSSDTYGVLFDKYKTTLIKYPIGNTRTYYEIPGSVTSVGEWAFSGCGSLTAIIIPESMVRIYGYAFRSCSALKDVFYYGTQAEWSSVKIDYGSNPLLSAAKHFGYTGIPADVNIVAPATLTIAPPAVGWYVGEASFTVTMDGGGRFLCTAALYDGATHTTLTPVYNADNSVTFTADITDGITIKVFVQGDVTDDGSLTADDIDALRAQIGAGFPGEIPAEQLLVSDMNGDGFINTRDLLILRKFLGTL